MHCLACCAFLPAERVGSFRVRSDAGQGGAGEDNSEELRQWIDKAINVEVPWLSSLVPWEPPLIDSLQPNSTAAKGPAGGKAGAKKGHGRLLKEQDGGGKEEGGQGERSGTPAGQQAEGGASAPAPADLPPQAPSKDDEYWWKKGLPAPPPPPPVGAKAAALLEELNRQLPPSSGPRHVCIQGKLENSRRNYSAAFEAIR